MTSVNVFMEANSAYCIDRVKAPLRNMQRIPLQSAEMERNERLRWSRKRRFETAAEAARFLGIPYGTYSGHENGSRGIKDDEIERYARSFRVSLPWLAYGHGSPDGNYVATRPAGYVGAGAEIIVPDDGAAVEDVELPPGAPPNTTPVIVRGNSMYPRYFDGERIFYLDDHHSPDELVGRECIVKLHDGRMFVKILRKGSKKRLFNLESWNAPTIEDQKLEWAAPIRWRG